MGIFSLHRSCVNLRENFVLLPYSLKLWKPQAYKTAHCLVMVTGHGDVALKGGCPAMLLTHVCYTVPGMWWDCTEHMHLHSDAL